MPMVRDVKVAATVQGDARRIANRRHSRQAPVAEIPLPEIESEDENESEEEGQIVLVLPTRPSSSVECASAIQFLNRCY